MQHKDKIGYFDHNSQFIKKNNCVIQFYHLKLSRINIRILQKWAEEMKCFIQGYPADN